MRALVILSIVVIIIIICMNMWKDKKEGFDASGYVYNHYPNWFSKKPYDMKDWLVPVYPDMIQPACLPYNVESKWGSLENMNYNSQAYKFWRF